MALTAQAHAEQMQSKTLALCAGAFVFALALWLRLHRLDESAFWMDESTLIESAQDRLVRLPFWARGTYPYSPLQLLLDHPLTRYTDSDFLWRLPHALFGAGAALLLFLFLLPYKGWAVAAVGGCLIAVNPLHISLSQETRHYASSMFFICLSLLMYARWMRSDDPPNSSVPQRWLGLVHCLGLLTFVYQGVAMLAQSAHVGLLTLIERRPAWLRLGIYLGLASVPLMLWLRITEFGGYKGTPPEQSIFLTAWDAVVQLCGASPTAAMVEVTLILIGVVALLIRREWRSPLMTLIFLAPLFFLPVYLDYRRPYFYHPRQVLNALPAFAGLAAIGAGEVLRVLPFARWRNPLLLGLSAAGIWWSANATGLYLYREHKPKELRPWMEQQANAGRHSIILNAHEYNFRTVRFYAQRYFKNHGTLIDSDIYRVVLRDQPIGETTPLERNNYVLLRENAAARDVYIFFDLFTYRHPPAALIEKLRGLPMVMEVMAEPNMIAVHLRAPELNAGGQRFDWIDAAVGVYAAVPPEYENHVRLRLWRALLPRPANWDELDKKMDLALKRHGF